MAHNKEQYGQINEYGNPNRQRVDENGNPIHHTSTTGGYGAAGYGTAPTQAAGMYDGAPVVGTGTVQEYHGLSGKLHHRSGSSSSSSPSEEDGHGGRTEKKGLKEKVEEKLRPGHHDRSQATPTTTPGGYYSAEQHREKKGIMEKIKEKLPGLHHDDHH